MNYRITHQSHYEYAETVSLSHNQARLSPRSFFNQTCLNSHITINPQPASFREQKDFFGNRTAYFSIEQPHNILSVTATSDVHIVSQAQLTSDMPWETVCHILKSTTDPDLLSVRQFALDSPKATTIPELRKYAEPSFSKDRPFIEAVGDLTQRIYNDFEYVPGFTTISTPLSDVFKHRKGVCQDFAHLAIGCLRAMGLAARYISGYLETQPSPDEEYLIGADASHAWFSVYLPNHGWIDFDPTNNLLPGDRHVTVSWGRDFADVTPLKGVVRGGGQHALTVSVTVEPIEGKFTPLQPPS